MAFTASSRARDRAGSAGVLVAATDRIKFAAATAGDHLAVHRFLRHVFQGPSSNEFQAQLDHPNYEPRDRILIKHDERIIAHVRVINREMQFGPVTIPIGWIADLGTLPEYRGAGHATQLLRGSEKRLRDDGAVVGLLRTKQSPFYLARGWVPCGGPSYSLAGPRHIRSYLSEHQPAPRVMLGSTASPTLHIRYWRHVEQAALMRLYQESLEHAYGACRRSEDHWRWLISRSACDRIYVAIEGSTELELDDPLTSIVGYAFVKNDRIVELCTAPHRTDAGRQLLARICGDAIEQDLHEIRLDAPPGDALHHVFTAAGGTHRCHRPDHGEVLLAKVFDPTRLAMQLKEPLRQRARTAGLDLPVELGLLADRERQLLSITPRSSKLVADRLGRSYLKCRREHLTQLLLGHLDVERAVAAGDVVASTRMALDTATALLPRLPLWYPPLDDLHGR